MLIVKTTGNHPPPIHFGDSSTPPPSSTRTCVYVSTWVCVYSHVNGIISSMVLCDPHFHAVIAVNYLL